jgi:hypothetical protein
MQLFSTDLNRPIGTLRVLIQEGNKYTEIWRVSKNQNISDQTVSNIDSINCTNNLCMQKCVQYVQLIKMSSIAFLLAKIVIEGR